MDIKALRKKYDLTQDELSVHIDVPRARLAAWETGKGNPKAEDFAKLVNFFANKGEDMTDEPEYQIRESSKKEITVLGKQVPLRLKPDEYAAAYGDWQGLPMYNVPVTASFVESYRDEDNYRPQYYLHDPRFRDCDFGVIITGDSMHSEIRHGDFIACKEIKDPSFLVYGDIYYVVAMNGLETCKYVNADPHNPDNILLVPRNESISPSPLPRNKIKRIYKVRGIVRGY